MNVECKTIHQKREENPSFEAKTIIYCVLLELKSKFDGKLCSNAESSIQFRNELEREEKTKVCQTLQSHFKMIQFVMQQLFIILYYRHYMENFRPEIQH
jgi:hypothetical protein